MLPPPPAPFLYSKEVSHAVLYGLPALVLGSGSTEGEGDVVGGDEYNGLGCFVP